MNKVCTTFLLILITLTVNAQWNGKVENVLDGDTYRLKRGDSSLIVRLYGVRCPMMEQPYGEEATERAKNKIIGKTLRVRTIAKNYLDQPFVKIYHNDTLLNKWLVKKGLAWVYPNFCSQHVCDEWMRTELKIRQAGYGLWRQNNPVAPWRYSSNGE